jgi:hypothetical protein
MARARPLLLGLLGLAAAILVLRVVFDRPRAVVGEPPSDGYTRVVGVVHVHTTSSDGGGTPAEVAAAARAAGLRFVAITDHNNLDAKSAEGYRDGVLVLVGTELSTTAGHLLVLGIPDPAFRFSGDPRDGLEDARDLGGVAFAAHPLSARDDLRWSGWDLPGSWGLELLNGDSEWRSAGSWRLLRTAALYGLNRRHALLGSLLPPTGTLARWDALLAERDVAGIVGADAHSRVPVRKGWTLRFPSYEALFSVAREHVLLDKPLSGDAAADGRAIVEALGRGRAYVGLDGLAPAEGFSFVAEAGGRRVTMGETIAPEPPPVLRAGGQLPKRARLRLLRDGRVLKEGEGPLEVAAPGPGVYRIEAFVSGEEVPWVLSNPIYVFDDSARRTRAARAAWPAEPPAPPPAQVLDDFEGRTVFAPEFDPSSAMENDVLARGAGVGGRTAGRLAFRLGAPGPGRPYTWCALVNREGRDLSGRTGLTFAVKADGVYRVWVQVRDENPASADEGTEWWFASVRTSAEWRRVAIPFARFRSINKRTDGRLDLDKIRQLVFVLDPAAVKPGMSGTIWLDDVGVY